MEKRKVSVLVPYKVINGLVYLFMQKRAKNHERGGDMFGFFGGGIQETETPVQALVRESKEELNIIPENFRLFKVYNLSATKHFSSAELYLFLFCVNDDFERDVIVSSEGQYAKWFSREDYLQNKESIAGTLSIMDEIFNTLEKKV
ncbi:MAG: NUDIX domain-containing protein [Candidatus Paceibacterota bacterium]|jgi:8-oxo-dGTP pyrophosphatase MutT (NUDIX family)